MTPDPHAPEDADRPRGRPRRRWPQFSLRTLMALSLITALTVAWWNRWTPTMRELPDGMRLLSATRLDLSNGQQLRHGAFRAVDKHWRGLIRGGYSEDVPSGNWTTYHTNGRAASSGSVQHGRRVGRWSFWNEDGRRIAEIHYRDEPWTAVKLRFGNFTKIATEYRTCREGAARMWWDNGHPRAAGSHRWDRRQGPWKFWDRAGKLRAEGEYDLGRKQGEWSELNASGKPIRVYYAADRPLGAPDVARKRLRAAGEKMSAGAPGWPGASRLLRDAGPDGAPLLAAALRSPRPDVRLAALHRLSELGETARSQADKVLPLLKGDSVEQRLSAAVALFCVDRERQPDALSVMSELIAQRELTTAEASGRLAKYVTPDVVGLESIIVEQTDPELRKLAAHLLRRLSESRSLATQAVIARRLDDSAKAVDILLRFSKSTNKELSDLVKRSPRPPPGRGIGSGGFF